MPTTIDPAPAAAPWWVRDGLAIDGDGRLTIAGEDAERLARRPFDAAASSMTGRASPRTRAGSLDALDRLGPPPSAPVRAEGQSRTADPRGAPAARRHRRVLAGRGRSGPSSAAGGPTRSATPARTSRSGTWTSSSPSRSTSTSTRSARSSGSAGGRRARRSGSGSTRPPAPATTPGSSTAATGRRSSASTRTTCPRRWRRRPAIDLTIDTIHFHAGSGWLGGRSARSSRRRSRRPPRITARPAGRRPPDRRGQRRRRPRRSRRGPTSRRSTSTPTPRSSPGTSARSASPSAASRATTSPRTPRSCSPRS